MRSHSTNSSNRLSLLFSPLVADINFCRQSFIPIATAYSGDLTNINRAMKHKIIDVIQINQKCSIVKLCPPVYGSTLVSLTDNFNYQTNTTGKLVYFKPDLQVWFSIYLCIMQVLPFRSWMSSKKWFGKLIWSCVFCVSMRVDRRKC
jgi:hypothetical protein